MQSEARLIYGKTGLISEDTARAHWSHHIPPASKPLSSRRNSMHSLAFNEVVSACSTPSTRGRSKTSCACPSGVRRSVFRRLSSSDCERSISPLRAIRVTRSAIVDRSRSSSSHTSRCETPGLCERITSAAYCTLVISVDTMRCHTATCRCCARRIKLPVNCASSCFASSLAANLQSPIGMLKIGCKNAVSSAHASSARTCATN